jgi:predicted alpha/beta superfamily hydrolase
MEGDAAKLATLLKQYKSKEARIKHTKMPQETHLTILHRAVYNALLWMNGQ